MADPRTDFFASSAVQPDQGADADPRTAFFASGVEPEKASKPLPHVDPKLGALETIAHYGSAAVSLPFQAGASLYKLATSPAGTRASEAAKASQAVGEAMTYQPRSAEGQQLTSAADTVLGLPGRLGDRAAQAIAGPNGEGNSGLAAAADVGIQAIPSLLGVRGVRAVPGRVAGAAGDLIDQASSAPRGWGGSAPNTAQGILTQAAQNSPQSMGAAAASPRLSNASPQLQQAIVSAAQRTGGAVNPDALARHVEADTLPVPIRLTEGEALADVTRISNERNSAALADFYNDRNGKLKQNIQAIRDEVGPDVFSRNTAEHGDTLIKAYQDKAAVADADIDAKYQALRDANGGRFPIDVKTLLSNVDDNLHQQLLYEHAPTQLGQLQRLAEKGSMTFEQFEAMRTNLARTMRSSSDGNERAAAGIIRQQMEQLPLTGETAQLKPLADAARSAARTQFSALDADPAYKAAVQEKVAPDDFVRRFVIGGKRDDVALMRDNLKDDPTAMQTIGVAAIDHLRDAAKVNADGTGSFTQAGFNKALRGLDPKIRYLFDPAHAETLEQLGNVARYTQEQPAGNFINNSKTFVASAAEHGAGLAEGLANAKAGGIPVGTMGRRLLDKRAQRAVMKRITAPGAGLDVLETRP